MDRIPESAYRQPPPPRRCSDSSMLSKEGVNSNTSMVGVYLNSRIRSYSFRRCKGMSSTTIESLPDELLIDILARLPADYLYDIAKLVCLWWYHIIHSHAFVNTQLQHSTYGLLLSPCTYESPQSSRHPCFVSATTQGQIEISELSYECRTRTRFGGSCNGLGLECHSFSELPYIINPVTKQVFVLPECPCGYYDGYTCSIAYAAASGEYKVTLPHRVRGQSESSLDVLILTLGVDISWRYLQVQTLPRRARGHFCYDSLCTEGFIHWTPYNGLKGTRVVTLDVESEVLTMSEVPVSQPYKSKPKYYLSTGRYLSLLVATSAFSWQVWWMEPETREWRKLPHDINLKAEKCRLKHIVGDQALVPLGWVKYPEVLAMSFWRSTLTRTCIFYNLDTHEISSIELRGHSSALGHKKSLMWLA